MTRYRNGPTRGHIATKPKNRRGARGECGLLLLLCCWLWVVFNQDRVASCCVKYSEQQHQGVAYVRTPRLSKNSTCCTWESLIFTPTFTSSSASSSAVMRAGWTRHVRTEQAGLVTARRLRGDATNADASEAVEPRTKGLRGKQTNNNWSRFVEVCSCFGARVSVMRPPQIPSQDNTTTHISA